jgi:glycosyltransferase involved in cell wall biosynthesis
MNNEPLVSICIPSYNSQSFIEETIKSILSQDYKNLEVIICDDRSSDNTMDVVKKFVIDERIVFHQNESNLGVGNNWNKTLLLAKGKYVKLMGADDILFPNCISEQVKILENPDHSDIVLVSSDKKIIDETGKEILNRKSPRHGKVNGFDAIRMCCHKGTNIIGEPVAGLYRTAVLKETGLYRGHNIYMIDLDLWSRILCLGNLFVINRPLYAFRISRTSLSFHMAFQQYKLFNNFIEELYQDPKFKITYTDRLIASIMSLIMVGVRRLFYILFL